MLAVTRTEVARLWLPYESLRTLYEFASEVRVYRNDLTQALQVGKRVETLGLEESVAVREGTLLQSIEHPNIVKVVDVAEVEASYIRPPLRQIEMIMPFFERGSLCDALQRGEQFSVVSACRHAIAALMGLAELHDVHRILHRDIKSGNVFLADDGSLMKVGDLSVAVPLDEDGTAEPLAEAMMFSAPETFTSERVDHRIDVYGMGLVLFELLNGRLPYELYDRDGLARRLEKGLRGVSDDHLRCGPHIPATLRRIINKAIARDPARRFDSARDMSSALARVDVLDWHIDEDGPDTWVWTGRHVRRSDRRFRVTATRRRRGGWSLTAEQCVTQWRRVLPDQIVAGLDSREASDFFDQLVRAV